MLRIACISDTHEMESAIKVPDCDVLVHAGDITLMGAGHKLAAFDQWCASLSIKQSRILVCAGNHDFCLERDPHLAKHALHNCTYLFDESIVIEGIKFYASPWQPRFFDWAFNLDRGSYELKEKWANIPDDTDVLITHGPPHGLGDVTLDGEHSGCELLLDRIREVRPKIHVCGHIHEGYGIYKTDFNTMVVNASVCNALYEPINTSLVVKL